MTTAMLYFRSEPKPDRLGCLVALGCILLPWVVLAIVLKCVGVL